MLAILNAILLIYGFFGVFVLKKVEYLTPGFVLGAPLAVISATLGFTWPWNLTTEAQRISFAITTGFSIIVFSAYALLVGPLLLFRLLDRLW